MTGYTAGSFSNTARWSNLGFRTDFSRISRICVLFWLTSFCLLFISLSRSSRLISLRYRCAALCFLSFIRFVARGFCYLITKRIDLYLFFCHKVPDSMRTQNKIYSMADQLKSIYLVVPNVFYKITNF